MLASCCDREQDEDPLRIDDLPTRSEDAYQSPPRSSRRNSEVFAAATAKSTQGRVMEMRGYAGPWAQLKGAFSQSRTDTWLGRPVFRSRRGPACLVWQGRPGQPGWWQVVPKFGSSETIAYARCPATIGPSCLPCQVELPWVVLSPPTDGEHDDSPAVEAPDMNLECVFVGQTVVVSGRSGHNQRLNGVYAEILDGYGDYPAYQDAQRHMFIYRRKSPPAWVIANRLGAGIHGDARRGRGVIFAENDDDVGQPYLTSKSWFINAWGRQEAEEDPNITVYLRSEVGNERVEGSPSTSAQPPSLLAVRSTSQPDVSGTYALRDSKEFNGQAVYVRSSEDEEKYIFWDADRWCIATDLGAPPRLCDVRSQKRAEACGRNHPDDVVWHGVEVLNAEASDKIPSSLLTLLKGRISSMSKHFS